jgi:hypothetical protein
LSQVSHTLRARVKAQRFDVDDLHSYTLAMQIGVRDLQLCVVDKGDNSILLLEDYALDGIKTVNARIDAIDKLYNDHALLKAGFWAGVKLSVKTHKFAMVPQSVFAPEAVLDYLSIATDIKPSAEDAKYYKLLTSDSVSVFATDKRLVTWLEQTYPSQKIQLVHQGSAFIEGVLNYDDHSHEKSMYCLIDGSIMHLLVTLKQKVFYYNQFAVREPQDFLKYMMLTFKETGLDQKSSKVLLWGSLKLNSPIIALLKKYIRNISFGGRPNYLKYSYEFDDILEHQYFDVQNIPLCE